MHFSRDVHDRRKPPGTSSLELRWDGRSSEMEILERITLRGRNGRTTVIKEVTIKNHGVPWILVPIIWFVTRFGRPAEPDILKSMCESDRSPIDQEGGG